MSGQSPLSEGKELTVLAEGIAKETYKLLEKLPGSEQWDLEAKLRSKAIELAATLPEAAGALDPRDVVWKLSQARGQLTALLSLAKVAHAAGHTGLDPEYMLKIKKAIDLIDKEVPAMPVKARAWLAANYPNPVLEDKEEHAA